MQSQEENEAAGLRLQLAKMQERISTLESLLKSDAHLERMTGWVAAMAAELLAKPRVNGEGHNMQDKAGWAILYRKIDAIDEAMSIYAETARRIDPPDLQPK